MNANNHFHASTHVDQLIFIALAIFLCILLPTFADAQESSENIRSDQTYDTVEERRLHVRIIEEHDELNNERKLLLLKEKELEKLNYEINLKLEELDRKLDKLAKQKAEIQKMQAGNTETTESPIRDLSKIYEQMDQVKAAIAIAGLEPETAAMILTGMKSRSAARILEIIDSRRAAEITKILVTLPR